MTPLLRLLTCTLKLAAVLLLPGCTRLLVERGPRDQPAPARDALLAQAAGQRRISPYLPEQPGQPVRPPGRFDPSFQGAGYQSVPAEPELVPAPAELLESPAPPAAPPRVKAEPPPLAPQQPAAVPQEEPLLAALRYLLEKQPDKALELLQRYDHLNQDVMVSLLALAVRLTQGSLEQAGPQEVSNVMEQLNSLAVLLRSLAALSIEKMCFCSEISRFGVYQPLPARPVFQPGRDGRPGEQIQLYVELRNFVSQPQASFYETRLASTLEIRDLRNKPVWRMDFPAQQPDRSHTLRHDYFISFRFPVPREVPPGLYTLWVEVRDVTGIQGREVPAHRVARRSLDFEVKGPAVAHSPGKTAND